MLQNFNGPSGIMHTWEFSSTAFVRGRNWYSNPPQVPMSSILVQPNLWPKPRIRPLKHFRQWAMPLNTPELKQSRGSASFPSHFTASNDTVGTCPRVSSGTRRRHRIPTFPKGYKYTSEFAGSLWHLIDALNHLRLSTPRRVLGEIRSFGHQKLFWFMHILRCPRTPSYYAQSSSTATPSITPSFQASKTLENGPTSGIKQNR
jgi:hypothetical protein